MAGPFDAWLTLRGIKTLAARMDKHCANAARVARMLTEHPAVESVLYPGLAGHPGHELAKSQMRDFGGMVSFRVRGGEEAAVAVCARTRLFTLGESLGGVESLIEHPARMTHASRRRVSVSRCRRIWSGCSVGIEDPVDLRGRILSPGARLACGWDPSPPPPPLTHTKPRRRDSVPRPSSTRRSPSQITAVIPAHRRRSARARPPPA